MSDTITGHLRMRKATITIAEEDGQTVTFDEAEFVTIGIEITVESGVARVYDLTVTSSTDLTERPDRPFVTYDHTGDTRD